jgi:hypothetical protein
MGATGQKAVSGDGAILWHRLGNRLDRQTGMPTEWFRSAGRELSSD